MYLLLELKDTETNFVDYIVTKDIQKTFQFINSILLKEIDYKNKLTDYLLQSNKRLSSLKHEVLFSDYSLLKVNNFLANIIAEGKVETPSNATVVSDFVKEPVVQEVVVVEEVKEPVVQEVIEEEVVVVEEVKEQPKTPKKRTKKPE